jgi:hypothetical protein
MSHGTVIFLTPLERLPAGRQGRLTNLPESCQGPWSKSKNHDELINFTGVVIKSAIFFVM